ncbi:MAG: phosphodiester glycosidase family protein [Nitrospinota bacterium]|nr:phosphodiester glycosidase family protein [Nitrospinota bacterium]
MVPKSLTGLTLVAGIMAALGFLLQTPSIGKEPSPQPWVYLEPGLEFGTFTPAQKSSIGDNQIRILKIDPKRFQLRLLNASASPGAKRLTAKEWAHKHGMVAAINASMYQADNLTSVSLMQTFGHVNNNWFSKDRAVLAFDPKKKSLPPAQILDRDCQNVDHLRTLYHTLIQSIRMVSCDGKNVWEQQNKKWSTAAIGMNDSGHILFIHVRSPFSTHDLINHLLTLPVKLKRAMYVEGGSEAQMYIHSGKKEMEFVGSFSSGSNETDANTLAWPIPNVVGITRRPPPKK